MKFAIISDIHANLEALQTVLADAKERKCTHYACVGDVVGYNANPKECLDIIREMEMPCVMGNHDEYCSADIDLSSFNESAATAVLWTREHLNEADKQWLKDLRYIRLIESFSIVHATMDGPRRWGYVTDKMFAAASFGYQTTNVCFHGHTHVPIAFMQEKGAQGIVQGGTYTRIVVEQNKRYFVNVGSVGQPRDGDPRASYATYDFAKREIGLHRLDYDIATTQRKIREAGLPERLAIRLELGR